MEMIFKTVDGKPIDDLVSYIRSKTKDKYNMYELYTGCDSQVMSNHVVFETVIVIYTVGKGAHIIHCKEKIPLRSSRKSYKEKSVILNRLWMEVEKVSEVALYLREHLKEDAIIHLDLNASPKHDSNALVANAVGYITALNFKCMIKPDAWVATHVADGLCKPNKDISVFKSNPSVDKFGYRVNKTKSVRSSKKVR